MPRRRILIVDDEEDIREIAVTSMELTRGWDVLTAPNGTEGIAKALAEMPDAILLDVMMPDMDGPAVFRLLRTNAQTTRIPVILLTAKVQTTDRQRYLRLGVEGVIAKPFDPLTLAERIAEMLRWDEGEEPDA